MAAPQAQQPPRRGSGMMVDWNKVPDTSGLVSGTYNVRIEKLFESTTGGGKACWKANLKVLPHASTKRMNNRVHTNTFTIGNDDDPMALEPDTINDAFGTRDMKHMFKAAQVKLESRMALTARAAIGKTLTIVGVLPKTPGKGQSRVFFNITEWLPLGKKEPCIDVETTDEEVVAASNGKPRRGAPAAEPEAEAEEGMEAEGEAGEAVEEPGDEEPEVEADAGEGADDEPEAEAAPPPRATKAAAAKAGAKEGTITCGMCEKPIARSKYKDHVPNCNG